MILINGCSFSTPESLKKEEMEYYWVNRFSHKFDMPITNLAVQGKSNRHIYRELYTYLIWAKQGKKELPKYVIMQTSDHFRDHLFSTRYSGEFKPNDFETQICRSRHNYVKLFRGIKHYEKPKFTGTTRTLYEGKEKIEENSVGDLTLREPMLRSLVEHLSLQNLCNTLGIPLIIFNMFGFINNTNKDPLYEELDQSSFILSNLKYGFYDHLCALDFSRPDEYHFGLDGHAYIADTIYDFIVNGTKVYPLQPLHNIGLPLFDYT